MSLKRNKAGAFHLSGIAPPNLPNANVLNIQTTPVDFPALFHQILTRISIFEARVRNFSTRVPVLFCRADKNYGFYGKKIKGLYKEMR